MMQALTQHYHGICLFRTVKNYAALISLWHYRASGSAVDSGVVYSIEPIVVYNGLHAMIDSWTAVNCQEVITADPEEFRNMVIHQLFEVWSANCKCLLLLINIVPSCFLYLGASLCIPMLAIYHPNPSNHLGL